MLFVETDSSGVFDVIGSQQCTPRAGTQFRISDRGDREGDRYRQTEGETATPHPGLAARGRDRHGGVAMADQLVPRSAEEGEEEGEVAEMIKGVKRDGGELSLAYRPFGKIPREVQQVQSCIVLTQQPVSLRERGLLACCRCCCCCVPAFSLE